MWPLPPGSIPALTWYHLPSFPGSIICVLFDELRLLIHAIDMRRMSGGVRQRVQQPACLLMTVVMPASRRPDNESRLLYPGFLVEVSRKVQGQTLRFRQSSLSHIHLPRGGHVGFTGNPVLPLVPPRAYHSAVCRPPNAGGRDVTLLRHGGFGRASGPTSI